MVLNITYAPYSTANKQLLKALCVKRWKDVGKRFAYTIILPVICAVGILLLLNAPIIYGVLHGTFRIDEVIVPTSMEQVFWWLEVFAFLAMPAYFIICLANLIMFFQAIPSSIMMFLREENKLFRLFPSHTIWQSLRDIILKQEFLSILFLRLT